MNNIKCMIKNNSKYIKTAIDIAWPAVMESFFVAFIGIIDSMMVSSIGAYAVAAVGLTTQPKFLGLALFIATNIAVSAVVARRKGEKNQDEANRALLMAFIFTVFAGIIVTITAVAFAGPIIKLCGSQKDTHDSAVLYFRIIMGGMLFNIISLVINAAQRGVGNTKIAMKTNITSNIVNVIFNYLLINGNLGFPKMGIRGAAIATVLGTVVACIMSIRSICKKDTFLSIRYILEKKLKPGMETAKALFKVASSTFIEQIMIRIGFMSVSIMTARLGTDAFAAHNVGMNVMSLSFSFGDGMQVAAVSLIGQSLGAKDTKLAKKYGYICQRIGNTISAILSVIYLVGGRFFFGLYFKEPYIVDMGVKIMKVMVIIVLLQIAQVIYMGCLRGAGDVVFTTTASTISITFIRPLMSYVFCYLLDMGLIGVWYGILADQICRATLTTLRFKSGRWTTIKI